MTYGTVIVDLERRRVVDLLPDRSAASTATWLKAHPEVEIVSRDRAGLYAEGAREGSPQALQVADRFHCCRISGKKRSSGSSAYSARRSGKRPSGKRFRKRNVSTTLRQPAFEFKLGFLAFGLAG